MIKARKSKQVYFLRQRIGGELVRKTLGTVGEITREEAMLLAQEVASRYLSGAGVEPVTAAAVTDVQVTDVQVQDLFDRYMRIHSAPHKKSTAMDEWKWEKHVAKYAAMPVNKFREFWPEFHVQIGAASGKVMANRVGSMVAKMFRVSDIEPPKWRKFREVSRERFLSHDEVTRLLEAVEQSSIRDFVLLCLYTGARSGNVRQMEWTDVNLSERVWTVPAAKSKNGRIIHVHLTDKALAVLKGRSRVDGTDYVFPLRQRGGSGCGVVRDAPMWRPGRQWDKLCQRAGLEGITIHDLRRTVGSRLAMAGHSMPTIARVLGHADLSSVQVYARIADRTANDAVDAVAAGF